jgi:hypothetical protein
VTDKPKAGADKAKKPPEVTCRECGMPFANARQLERARKKAGVPASMVERCPACRGKAVREKLAGLLRGAGQNRARQEPAERGVSRKRESGPPGRFHSR